MVNKQKTLTWMYLYMYTIRSFTGDMVWYNTYMVQIHDMHHTRYGITATQLFRSNALLLWCNIPGMLHPSVGCIE